MDRLRNAGWLILIQPIALALQVLRSFETNGVRSAVNRQFLDNQFVFWAKSVDTDLRLRVLVNTLLFIAAVVTGLTVILRRRPRRGLVGVAVAQVIVAVSGIVWAEGDAPTVVARTVPVLYGRWTSAFFFVCAVLAIALATRGRRFLARR